MDDFIFSALVSCIVASKGRRLRANHCPYSTGMSAKVGKWNGVIVGEVFKLISAKLCLLCRKGGDSNLS